MDDKGSDGDNDHVHRRISVVDVHSEGRGENKSRSSLRYFHWENIHTSMVKPLIGEEDERTASARSKMRGARGRSVHGGEIPTVVRKADGDCRNCFHDRMNRCNLHFRSEAEMDRCNGLDGVGLRSVAHSGSWGGTNCEKLATSNGVQSQRMTQQRQVDEVCLELGNPMTRLLHPCFVELLNKALRASSCRNL